MKLLYPIDTLDLFKRLTEQRELGEYLAGLLEHHEDSFEHSWRVGLYAVDLGIENKLAGGLLYPLGYSGSLHDVGKKEIPLEILAKEGPLTEEEKRIIKQHPRLGFLFAKDEGMMTVRKVIVGHHEFKREGAYPRSGKDRRKVKRRGPERRRQEPGVRQLAQMVAVADVYDALRNKREYKEALAEEEVERILKRDFTGEEKYVEQMMGRGD